MMKKEHSLDDDGRTIADMSRLDQNSVLSGTLTGLVTEKNRRERRTQGKDSQFESTYTARESDEDKKQRRAYTMGAMSAGLVIGLMYLAAFGIVILLLLIIWGAI